MDSDPLEILFAAVFAALVAAVAVYFVYLNLLARRKAVSVRFRVAIAFSAIAVWSLFVIAFLEYCGAWARAFRHTHVSELLRDTSSGFFVTGFLCFIIGAGTATVAYIERRAHARPTI